MSPRPVDAELIANHEVPMNNGLDPDRVWADSVHEAAVSYLQTLGLGRGVYAAQQHAQWVMAHANMRMVLEITSQASQIIFDAQIPLRSMKLVIKAGCAA